MSDETPEGSHWEWIADDSWMLDESGDKCSMPRCNNTAVAGFFRKRERRSGRVLAWYRYCVNHLYGRKIEEGIVKFQRLVKNMEDVA
ncbi:MAG: hypothetical protein ACRD20_20630 [Terriglobales bacterium]